MHTNKLFPSNNYRVQTEPGCYLHSDYAWEIIIRSPLWPAEATEVNYELDPCFFRSDFIFIIHLFIKVHYSRIDAGVC